MEIEIEFTKTAQDNAKSYFEKSKKEKLKADGALKAVEELKNKLKNIEKEKIKSKEIRTIEKREWYEKYNWFYTSSGELVIGGRSADQNEEIYAKQLNENDLFFHSDIFGASVVVLKDGIDSNNEVRHEVAQFAASFSKAWENAQGTVDVYSVKKDQVSKSKNYGSLGKGSFMILGEREWYKGVELGLYAYLEERTAENGVIKKFSIIPKGTFEKKKPQLFVSINIGNTKKSDAAKKIAAKLKYDNIDYIMQHLPPGSFSIK